MAAGRPMLALILLIPFLLQGQSFERELNEVLSTLSPPVHVEDVPSLFHIPPVNQDSTLVCWSFATTSFIESEMHRLGLEPVRLSRMYPVYCTFLEKAKRFVTTRGNSIVEPGDLFGGVLEVAQSYGLMPEEVYRGQVDRNPQFHQTVLYRELRALMRQVRDEQVWDEERVLPMVREVLDRHLGRPPERFRFRGTEYTPAAFAERLVGLPWQEYMAVTSFRYAPYDTLIELTVPDNWAHRADYLNVPLDVFYTALRDAVARGYSAAIDTDISEPSYRTTKAYGVIPPFDLPYRTIDDAARQFRFENRSTTDDHLMHIVGYDRRDGHDWFLVKDSWHTAFEGPLKGYFFFHESYVKLKVLAYLVHRDGIPVITQRRARRP